MLLLDPALRRHPGLVESVVVAGGFALENGRLHADVAAQLLEVRASRARIVEEAMAERRRLERDLHDGAQQSLLAVTTSLTKARLQARADPEMTAAIDPARADLGQAHRELRDLARGIHPAVLSQSGLAPAVEGVAERLGFACRPNPAAAALARSGRDDVLLCRHRGAHQRRQARGGVKGSGYDRRLRGGGHRRRGRRRMRRCRRVALPVDRPEVVVLDICMPPTFTDEGLRAAEEIRERHPEVGVLVLSTYNETSHAVRLVEGLGTGVGYLLKDRVDDVDALRDALVRVRAGQSVIDPAVVTRLFRRCSRNRCIELLTAKERDVLRQLAEGQSNVGVGQALGMSARTVEAHVAGVFAKLELPPDADVNRRVLAVLTWLRAAT